MRRPAIILFSTLALSVGLVPATAYARSATGLAVSSAAPTVTATPEVTATATPTATTEPSATPTVTPTTKPTTPGSNPKVGTLVLTPTHGKPGTVITVASKTLCVDSKGKVDPAVEFALIDGSKKKESEAILVDKVFSTTSTGAWSTTATIPSTAKPGTVFAVVAACFPVKVKPNSTVTPTIVYNPKIFTVTKGNKSPVATPVPGTPKFTG